MKLKILRKAKNLKLREIATLLNVSPQVVWKHERYGIRSSRTAKKYAAALGVDWQELID